MIHISTLFTRFFVLGILFCSISSSAEDNTPFIYYYSQDQHAFVIEDTLGSGRQILADFDFSQWQNEYQLSVAGPGWSPSGKWFAWTLQGIGRVPLSIGIVVNLDTRKVLSVIDTNNVYNNRADYRVNMSWSPSEDLLLVEYTSSINDVSDTNIYVYNPNEDRISLLVDNALHQYIGWSPRGNLIYLYDINYSLNQAQVSIIDLNGKRIDQSITITADCGEWSLPYWTSDERLMYLDLNQSLIVEDYKLGTKFSIDIPNKHLRYIDSSPNNDFALIFTKTNRCWETGGYDLWLLNLRERIISPVDEDTKFYLPTGKFTNTEYARQLLQNTNVTAWTPDSSNAILVSSNDMPSIFILTPNSLHSTTIDLSDVNYISEFKWNDTRTKIMLLGSARDKSSLVFGDISDISSLEKISDDVITSFSIAPDNLYISYSSDEEYVFYNTTTKSSTSIKLSYQGDSLGSQFAYRETIWDKSSRWVFTVSHSDSYLNLLHVISPEKSVAPREIGFCPLTPSCFGWMPL